MQIDESLRPPPPGPESATWFREQLAALGWSKGDLIRYLLAHGDDRQPKTIERSLCRITAGEARVSGELRVVLTVLRKEITA